MVRASISGKMVENIKEIMLQIKNMVMVFTPGLSNIFIIGLTVEDTKENGRMVNKMVKGNTLSEVTLD